MKQIKPIKSKTPKWQVVKLEGNFETYDEGKVADAIFLAAQEAKGTDKNRAMELAKKVTDYLVSQYGRRKEISTRDIGDAVERILIEAQHVTTARIYILNRDRKREEYEAKIRLGVKDDIGMSLNSLVVMKNKYLLENETPRQAFTRVAGALAKAETTKKEQELWEAEFTRVMTELKFLPGGRTLANAGTINNQLANCFVMPFPDDIEGIFEMVKESSILKKNGGAVGFSFSKVRPKGDAIRTTSGGAAGPVALMGILDHASEIFRQAGGRRSGNMVTLSVSHPDIFEFIDCKESGTNLPNINYSLEVSNAFMKAVEEDETWPLVNPRSGEATQTVSARSIWEQAARLAWKRGDPGMIFIDEINKYNPTPQTGRLNTVNLCGEQPLLDYEACNLGSVNIARHLKAKAGKQSTVGDYEIDYQALEQTVRVGVRMLDNVITVCKYPLKQIDEVVKANRKVGLGVMGWADTLIRLGIPYNTQEARVLAGKVMKFIQKTAWKESEKLAREKGSFPEFKGSIWEKRGFKKMRNATLTTIAPTGSLSMVAGVSGGIEPLFALAFYRKAMSDYELPEVNQDLIVALKRHNGTYSAALLDKIAQSGSIQNSGAIPEQIKKVFMTAMDIAPEDHVLMQAQFQKFTDNAVSKTINLLANATVDDVIEIFTLAWRTKCKGITVYRDKSREVQVLNVGAKIDPGSKSAPDPGSMRMGSDKCPSCGGKHLRKAEGCESCPDCGYSACSV